MYPSFETSKMAPTRMRNSIPQFGALACAITLTLIGAGCSSTSQPRVPAGVTVLKQVETKRLAGTWYEVARLNHWAERGLTRETVTFTPRPMNRWLVVHRGWRNETGTWEETAIHAKPTTEILHSASLRGRFTSPIPSDIHIVSMDPSYQCALVCGANQHSLWLLSREQNPPHGLVMEMLNEARSKGFPVEEALFLQFQ